MSSDRPPWLALACDWQDDPMFNDAKQGVRLAWICLLCHAVDYGFSGTVRVRLLAFARLYNLAVSDVSEMLSLATHYNRIIIWEDEMVSVLRWEDYNRVRIGRDSPFVYFMQNHSTKQIKIGVSSSPERRARKLSRSECAEVVILAVMRGGYELERRLHDRFASLRVRGEWFEDDIALRLFMEAYATPYT